VAFSRKITRSKGAAWITCPRRRDDLFKMARAECLKIGFKLGDVHRRVGIDWKSYTANQMKCTCDVSNKWCWCGAHTRMPPGLKKHTFLMYDFHVFFLPTAINFMKESGYQWVAWLEDDVKFPANRRVEEFADLALGMSPATVWAGYMKVGGKPKWQSHLLLMSLKAAERMLAELDASEAAGMSHKRGHLVGLDTWVCNCMSKMVGGQSLVRASPSSMGSQRGHEYRWRN